MKCSLHPFRLIEGPLTLNFNTIIPACQSLSRYPHVCLAGGRCSELLISLNQLISAPSLNGAQCSYVAWRKIPVLKPFIYTHPDFQRSPVLFPSLSVLGPIYHQSFITMTWHTFSDYAGKA